MRGLFCHPERSPACWRGEVEGSTSGIETRSLDKPAKILLRKTSAGKLGMTHFVSQFKKWLGERIFPIFCLGCGQEGGRLCQSCILKPEQSPKPLTEVKPDLDGVFSLFSYSDQLIAGLIHKLKYESAEDIMDVFDFYLKRFLLNHSLPSAVLLPIPLHRRRLALRGFNQGKLITQSLALASGLPWRANQIRRVRHTSSQVGLSGVQREENITGAFALRGRLDGEAVILVDDVYTTGSTLKEAARVCRQAGAVQVWGFTIAREF